MDHGPRAQRRAAAHHAGPRRLLWVRLLLLCRRLRLRRLLVLLLLPWPGECLLPRSLLLRLWLVVLPAGALLPLLLLLLPLPLPLPQLPLLPQGLLLPEKVLQVRRVHLRPDFGLSLLYVEAQLPLVLRLRLEGRACFGGGQ
jgi:hypothetical protein